MPVSEILLLRHGHRIAWNLDPTTGVYHSNHPYPTRLPADPPLASYGVQQAEETAEYLGKYFADAIKEDRLRIYSSLFYRCLQTLRPIVENLRDQVKDNPKILKGLEVRGERGFGEWFGHAWFEQPIPAKPSRLKNDFFPWVNENYESLEIPDKFGERINVLHDRIGRAFEKVIEDVNKEFEAQGRSQDNVVLLICGHAAQIIASGRALTGQKPNDYDEEDFFCFTCGISKFLKKKEDGLIGDWDCVLNSDCTHLSQGPERGWHFHGDESFDSYNFNLEPVISLDDVKVVGSKL